MLSPVATQSKLVARVSPGIPSVQESEGVERDHHEIVRELRRVLDEDGCGLNLNGVVSTHSSSSSWYMELSFSSSSAKAVSWSSAFLLMPFS